jgi:hypothetical protein
MTKPSRLSFADRLERVGSGRRVTYAELEDLAVGSLPAAARAARSRASSSPAASRSVLAAR